MALEHRDRANRLQRLAGDRVGLQFFEEEITPAEHGLYDFPVNLPVLRVVAGQNVFFDSGSDVIRPEAFTLLDIIAESLKREPPDVVLFVAGHTDADGDEAYNLALGQRRALAVAAALITRGIYQVSIYRVSFGEILPVSDNDSDAGKARNRRVEFLFSARTQAIVASIEKQAIEACSTRTGDALKGCRKAINIEATKIEIGAEDRTRVMELAQESQALTLDPTLTEVELEARRVEIEHKRQRIEIKFDPVRIPIVVGPAPPGG